MSGRLVPAVDRAAKILALIESEARPMSITEVARALEASKGTVREILETLRSHGLLERDLETKLYQLGPQLVRLGASSLGGKDLASVARPWLSQLSDEMCEIVLLLTLQQGRLFIREVFEPSDPRTPILVAASPGRSIPASAGACGRVLLAWDVDVGNATRLSVSERDEIRERGYAVDDGEYIEGIRGISAPILGEGDKPVGLILVSGIAASLSIDRLDNAGKAARRAAVMISKALGTTGVEAGAA